MAAVTGGFGAAFWNDVAITGPRYLIWSACALSAVAVGSLYLCFAVLGGWWPARGLAPGAASFAAPTLIARGRHDKAPGLTAPDVTEVPPPSGDYGPAVGRWHSVGDIPEQPRQDQTINQRRPFTLIGFSKLSSIQLQ